MNHRPSTLHPIVCCAIRRPSVHLCEQIHLSCAPIQRKKTGAAARLSTDPVVWNGIGHLTTQSLSYSRSAAPASWEQIVFATPTL
jgi:hypothetical protein